MIGHGAIASYVAKNLKDDQRFAIQSALSRPGRENEAKRVLGEDVIVVSRVDAISGPIDVAVDCAGHGALREHGADLLRRGIDLLTVSNGALADAELTTKLIDAAERGNAKLRLLSGALGAIDAISAARIGGLEFVRYTGRKPPKGWIGSPAEDVITLSGITEPTIHFKGSAREAALSYPKNANVAATVALAGVGLDATEVCLIADPTLDCNRHHIEASGAFGSLTFTIEGNALPDNPKSSALTAMSVIAALRSYVEPLVQ